MENKTKATQYIFIVSDYIMFTELELLEVNPRLLKINPQDVKPQEIMISNLTLHKLSLKIFCTDSQNYKINP